MPATLAVGGNLTRIACLFGQLIFVLKSQCFVPSVFFLFGFILFMYVLLFVIINFLWSDCPIGVAGGGDNGAMPPNFLENALNLCFERRFS